MKREDIAKAQRLVEQIDEHRNQLTYVQSFVELLEEQEDWVEGEVRITTDSPEGRNVAIPFTSNTPEINMVLMTLKDFSERLKNQIVYEEEELDKM